MDNLLRYAYFSKRCNHCGGEFAWTLEQVYEEQQIQSEDVHGRPCSACHSEWLALVDAVPRDALAELERAWQALRATAAEHGLPLQVGVLEPPQR